MNDKNLTNVRFKNIQPIIIIKIYIISASRYKNIIIKVFNKVGLKTLREKVIFVKMLILKIIYF